MEEENVDNVIHGNHYHPWKARFFTALIMLVLAFIGLVLTNIKKNSAWYYWVFTSCGYAILALWLGFYLRKKKHSMSVGKIWHEIVHWISTVISVYLVTRFVDIGIVGRFEAGLAILLLLALSTLLAGVYIEITFFFIGLLLGIFATVIALFDEYLYVIVVPVTAAICIIIFLVAYKKKKHFSS
jgi:hypothetical protein